MCSRSLVIPNNRHTDYTDVGCKLCMHRPCVRVHACDSSPSDRSQNSSGTAVLSVIALQPLFFFSSLYNHEADINSTFPLNLKHFTSHRRVFAFSVMTLCATTPSEHILKSELCCLNDVCAESRYNYKVVFTFIAQSVNFLRAH